MNCDLEFLYYINHVSNSVVPFHKHLCYELVYYISGCGKTSIENDEYSYTNESFTIIYPGCSHDEHHTQDTDILFIGFNNIPDGVNLKSGLHFDTKSNVILKILRKMKSELQERKTNYNIKLQSLLLELIVEISRMDSVKLDSKVDFSHIKKFLDENYSHEIDCNILAELSGYSYHRFRHIFKELYGISPHNYAMQLRLQNAEKILLSSTHTVSDICIKTGFSSESQLCSIFRKFYGYSPIQYRNKFSNK